MAFFSHYGAGRDSSLGTCLSSPWISLWTLWWQGIWCDSSLSKSITCSLLGISHSTNYYLVLSKSTGTWWIRVYNIYFPNMSYLTLPHLKFYIKFNTFSNICCENKRFVKYIWVKFNKTSDKESIVYWFEFYWRAHHLNFKLKSKDNVFFSHTIIPYS